MKKLMHLKHVEEQISEYLYNLSIPDQTEILNNNFGIDVKDTDEGVVWEGTLITDLEFDKNLIEIIENMSPGVIIDFWGNMINHECELDENNYVIWEEEE